ncbi:uncharacterized protein Dsk [Venturia canescens]|uniref:uncharacterized protein Dsk n=1 Tax=Venturia canescens TaxID=32260 RepID=UPI001C9C1AB3|nr:uncharacterized protein LOC122410445 [Venturia canescens]
MKLIPTTIVCLMALGVLLCGFCEAAAEIAPNLHRRFRNRLPSRGYSGDEFVVEDEDSMELNKRQLFDDYGHMRFGKRDRFDDYGHMRFGRNHE